MYEIDKLGDKMNNVFKLDYLLVTLNVYINAERRNRFLASKIKKENTMIVCNEAISQKIKINKEKQHDVFITVSTKNKRIDSDNLMFMLKFILDGFVKAEVLVDDNYKHIRNLYFYREIGKDSIEVTLKEL